MFTVRSQRLAAVALFSFACVHLIVIWGYRERIVTGYPDYSIFYTAGTLVRRGMADHLYDANLQYQLQRQFVLATQNGRGLLPYNHPPYEALLFVPFSYLSYMPGYFIWAGVNLLLFFFTIALVKPYLGRLLHLHWSLWVVLPIAFFPAFASLFEGQDSILLMLLYALAFVNLKRGRLWLAGVCLALALFKFQIVLPFMAVAILTRRWKVVSGFALASFALALVNIALVGWHTALYYPVFVRNLEKSTAGGAIVALNMPNLHGLINACVGRAHDSIASLTATVVISLFILLVIVKTIRQNFVNREQLDLCFSLAVVMSVLLSYHIFWYDWTVLLLPALLSFNCLAARAEIRTKTCQLLLICCVALFISPLYLVPLARFGHMYGLAILLLLWTWVLVLEIQSGSLVGRSAFQRDQLRAVVAQV